jgi:hypothetical protein
MFPTNTYTGSANTTTYRLCIPYIYYTYDTEIKFSYSILNQGTANLNLTFQIYNETASYGVINSSSYVYGTYNSYSSGSYTIDRIIVNVAQISTSFTNARKCFIVISDNSTASVNYKLGAMEITVGGQNF